MHRWGEDADWEGINNAAEFIGEGLLRWRVNVRQYKEKFGTVRVYCTLGIQWWPQLTNPGYYHNPWPKWTWRFQDRPRWLLRLVNAMIRPVHSLLYTYYYTQAVKRWPHLRQEIVSCADYEYLIRALLPACPTCKRRISNWIPAEKWACQCARGDNK